MSMLGSRWLSPNSSVLFSGQISFTRAVLPLTAFLNEISNLQQHVSGVSELIKKLVSLIVGYIVAKGEILIRQDASHIAAAGISQHRLTVVHFEAWLRQRVVRHRIVRDIVFEGLDSLPELFLGVKLEPYDWAQGRRTGACISLEFDPLAEGSSLVLKDGGNEIPRDSRLD